VQGSFYYGEMPVPTGTPLLVPNTNSVHLFVPKQCMTCHMQSEESEGTETPTDSGHSFELKTTGCSGRKR